MEENIKQNIKDLKDIRAHIKNANIAINNSNIELTRIEHNFLKEVSDYLFTANNTISFIIAQKEEYLRDWESI